MAASRKHARTSTLLNLEDEIAKLPAGNIRVKHPHNVGHGMMGRVAPHHEYKVEIRGVPGIQDANVDRRYSDFEWLRNALQKTYPGVLFPPLPPKILKIYLDRSPGLLEMRRKGLEEFLHRVVSLVFPVKSSPFKVFAQDYKNFGDSDIFSEKNTVERKIRTRSYSSLLDLFQTTFVIKELKMPIQNPDEQVKDFKSFLPHQQGQMIKVHHLLNVHVDKLFQLRNMMENFGKILDTNTKLDEQFAGIFPKCNKLRKDCSDYFNFSYSAAGSGVQAWSALAGSFLNEADFVPTMQNAINSWAAAFSTEHPKATLEGELGLDTIHEEPRQRRTISRPHYPLKKKCFQKVTFVMLRIQRPLYWKTLRQSFLMEFNTFAGAEVARHRALFSLCYNEVGANRQFGKRLDLLETKKTEFGPVPKILELLRQRLFRSGGLSTQGIFRISAKKSELETWKAWCNQSLHSLLQLYDPHISSNLIKLFFRSLPEPLINIALPTAGKDERKGNSAAEEMDPGIRDEEGSTTVDAWGTNAIGSYERLVVETVESLPESSQAAYKWLMHLSAEVALLDGVNLMNITNMSTVLAPNLVEFSAESFSKMQRFFETSVNIYSRYFHERVRAEKERLKKEEAKSGAIGGKAPAEKISSPGMTSIRERIEELRLATQEAQNVKRTAEIPTVQWKGIAERKDQFLKNASTKRSVSVSVEKPDFPQDTRERLASARSLFESKNRDISKADSKYHLTGSLTARSAGIYRALLEKQAQHSQDETLDSLRRSKSKKEVDFSIPGLGPLAEFYSLEGLGGPSPREQLLRTMRLHRFLLQDTFIVHNTDIHPFNSNSFSELFRTVAATNQNTRKKMTFSVDCA